MEGDLGPGSIRGEPRASLCKSASMPRGWSVETAVPRRRIFHAGLMLEAEVPKLCTGVLRAVEG